MGQIPSVSKSHWERAHPTLAAKARLKEKKFQAGRFSDDDDASVKGYSGDDHPPSFPIIGTLVVDVEIANPPHEAATPLVEIVDCANEMGDGEVMGLSMEDADVIGLPS